jgi:hypothetical protein
MVYIKSTKSTKCGSYWSNVQRHEHKRWIYDLCWKTRKEIKHLEDIIKTVVKEMGRAFT